jgi:hypothetical protein
MEDVKTEARPLAPITFICNACPRRRTSALGFKLWIEEDMDGIMQKDETEIEAGMAQVNVLQVDWKVARNIGLC